MARYTRFFADWEIHERTWLLTPRNPEVWGKSFFAAREIVVELANCIIDFEPVNLICLPGQARIFKSLLDARVELVELSGEDMWLRDSAPCYVASKNKVKAVRFAAGTVTQDSAIANLLCAYQGIHLGRERFSLFNNDVNVDNQGNMLSIETSVFHAHRRQLDREKVEKILHKRYGVKRIVWLPKALPTDPDKKLSNLARFVGHSAILLANHANRRDPCMRVTLDAYDQLSASDLLDDAGSPYAIFQIHNPPPLKWQGRSVCNSYVNCYIANGLVCIPAFYKPRYDKAAFEVFQAIFPNHHIRQFQVLPLLVQGGGINCISFAQPMAPKRTKQLLAMLDKRERLNEDSA